MLEEGKGDETSIRAKVIGARLGFRIHILVISCYLVSYAIVAIDDKDLHLDEAGYWLFWGGSSMSFTRNGVAKS